MSFSFGCNKVDTSASDSKRPPLESTPETPERPLPLLAITPSSTAINAANEASYAVSGTCTDEGTVTLSQASSVLGSANCSSGVWSAVLNLSSLGQGSLSLEADLVNQAGDASLQASETFFRDSLPPALAITQPASGSLISPYTSFSVTGSCESGAPLSFLYGAEVSGEASVDCIGGNFSITLNAAADSSSSYTVSQVDGFGNMTSLNRIVVIHALPNWWGGPWLGASLSSSTTESPDIYFDSTSTDATDSVQVQYALGSSGTGTGVDDIVAWSDVPSSNPFRVSGLSLSSATYHLSMRVVDSSGYASQASTSDWDVDLTPPVVTIQTPSAGESFGIDDTITLSGSCEASETVSFSYTNLNGPSAVSCDNSSFSVQLEAKGAACSVSVSESDQVGNIGTASVSFVFNNAGIEPFNVASGFDGKVDSLNVLPDGKIVVSGWFSNYRSTHVRNVARLNADGTYDSSFNPHDNLNCYGYGTATDPVSSKIYLAGCGPYFQRLNADGSVDSSYPIASDPYTVNAVTWDADLGMVYVGGSFDTYRGVASKRLARISPNGSVDANFVVGSNFPSGSSVARILLDKSRSKVYVGGSFATYGGASSVNLVRLNESGTRDSSFDIGTGFVGGVRALAMNPALDRLYVAGSFNKLNGQNVKALVRLNLDGSPDTTFTLPSDFGSIFSYITQIAVQPVAGKILVVGSYYSGSTNNYNIRLLNEDGSYDTAFNFGSGFSGNISDAAFDPSGSSVIVTGAFKAYKGVGVNSIARIDLSGNLVTSFNSGSGSDSVTRIRKNLAGTHFYLQSGNGFRNGVAVRSLHRIALDGSVDTAFDLGAGFRIWYSAWYPGTVQSFLEDPSDNGLYVVGNFDEIGGVARKNIMKVDSSGAVLTSFNPGTGLNGTAQALARDPVSGKIYVGGGFTSYRSTSSPGIVRINTDGTLDSSFVVGTGFKEGSGNGYVYRIVVDPHTAKVYVAGSFNSYKGATAARLVRLNTDGSLDSSFDAGLSPGFGYVSTLVYDSVHDKILAGGYVNNTAGDSRYFIRLNLDGTWDSSFANPALNSIVYDVAIDESLGRIVLGGLSSGANALLVLKLDTGLEDPSYFKDQSSSNLGNGGLTSVGNGSVQAVFVDPSTSKIYIGGSFGSYKGVTTNGFLRVRPNGRVE
ncbi:MAG: delta-60 repeat domain-containing protein [Bdellovibrionota bacterium]